MTVLSNAGEEEEEGYSDEYTLEDLEVGAGDYVKQEGVPDFRSAWDEMDDSTELADSYGLGQRDSMQEAVEAVIAILGMQVILFTTDHFMSVHLCCFQHLVAHGGCYHRIAIVNLACRHQPILLSCRCVKEQMQYRPMHGPILPYCQGCSLVMQLA